VAADYFEGYKNAIVRRIWAEMEDETEHGLTSQKKLILSFTCVFPGV